MQNFINFFGKLRGGIYFFILFALYIITVIIMVRAEMHQTKSMLPQIAFHTYILLTSSIYYIWFYSVAKISNQKTPNHLQLNFLRFILVFIITTALSTGMILVFIFKGGFLFHGGSVSILLYILSPIYLINIATWLYVCGFTARSIKIYEKKKDVSIYQSLLLTISLIILPISILWVQKRVRRIAESSCEEN